MMCVYFYDVIIVIVNGLPQIHRNHCLFIYKPQKIDKQEEINDIMVLPISSNNKIINLLFIYLVIYLCVCNWITATVLTQPT